jgi:hypothetical protein
MRRFLVVLAILMSFLTLLGEAKPNSHYHSKAHKYIKHKVSQPKAQQHHSFVPVYKPSETIARLQTSLIGHVVQQIQPPIEPPKPPSAQILVTPEQRVTQAPSTHLQPLAKNLKTGHHSWHWFHLHTNRPQKLRIQPEVITHAHSYVAPITPADAAQLSGLITQLIQEQIPDTKANLCLETVPTSQLGNTLTLNLQYILRNLGYTLSSEPSLPVPIVRYRVSNLDKALLVRVKINGIETARLYERSYTGALVAASPMTRMK